MIVRDVRARNAGRFDREDMVRGHDYSLFGNAHAPIRGGVGMWADAMGGIRMRAACYDSRPPEPTRLTPRPPDDTPEHVATGVACKRLMPRCRSGRDLGWMAK